jgi:UDP-N-acetylglucosamine transferase subunit ALG13
MKRAFLLMFLAVVMSTATLGQTASSDSQALQALLTEVRELRQDLRISLSHIQSGQILLSRLQTQQVAVTRASEHLGEAWSRLADAQDHQKHVAADLKRLEDMLSSEENLVQQKELRDRINHSKSELEESTDLQQRQANEIEAEQQLRVEQDKLGMLETQLDELVRRLGNPSEQHGRAVR